MTLSVVPAWKLLIVTTTGSNTSNRRVTMVCSAVTISHAAVIGSAARWGWEAWPPRPRTVTRRMSAAASIGPGRGGKQAAPVRGGRDVQRVGGHRAGAGRVQDAFADHHVGPAVALFARLEH